MAKNISKYHSYREAWSRINDAIDQGFYFEAVTICESIISDRLLSYVLGVDQNSGVKERASFNDLTQEWKKQAAHLPQYGSAGDLASAVDAWRIDRNSIVHGLVKSMPWTATEPVSQFINRAEKAANEGKNLAKAVSDWHKKELARANK